VSGRFIVVPNEDCPEVLEVVDSSNGANVCVATCWQEPNFAHDIARLLNGEEDDA